MPFGVKQGKTNKNKPIIVVTGKNGQLGWELQQIATEFTNEFEFLFIDREELDLSRPDSIPAFFTQYNPSFFINCGAYTLVDKAETERELTKAVNATSVGEIAKACAAIDCTLITISTDYVFDGNGTAPYTPNQQTAPLNYYGETKEEGEQLALANNQKTIIIRTSWVYSVHANNFVKTMLRLMKERSELKVVGDQVGSPTSAADLAGAILHIIHQMVAGNTHYGIYHYSNEGVISWFDFAVAINKLAGLSCNVLSIPTSSYPTPAKRPAYSVLDKQSIVADFNVPLVNWEISLEKTVAQLLV